jgi:hypothetical protein
VIIQDEGAMGGEALGHGLTGRYRVRAIRPAFDDVDRLVHKTRDKIHIRRHALKLRYWPENHPESESGQVLDLDWEWIRALQNERIGELRLDERIGGCDNLRIIFFVGPRLADQEMRIIWIVRVMQKKRMDFSRNDLAIFRARRTLVMERFYSS